MIRRRKIDNAPGKELIPEISHSVEAMTEFLNLRYKWHPHVLIHDGLATYSVFEDLRIYLLRNQLINEGISIARELIQTGEIDKSFIAGLLADLTAIKGTMDQT